MKRYGVIVIAAAVIAVVFASPMIGRADDDKKVQAVRNAVVDFGQPQPQGAPANTTHFLQPVGGMKDGEVTIFKNGTVTFRVNGGGHGVSVYRVSKKTTRDDIAAALCPTRSTCNAAFINSAHQIMDGDGELVVDIGANPPFGRVEDIDRIMVGTAALIPDGVDAAGNTIQVAGIFHQGTNCAERATSPNCNDLRNATPPLPARPVGEQIAVKFTKNGKFLVICMNRGHSINDHMFSFVNVVDDDDNN